MGRKIRDLRRGMLAAQRLAPVASSTSRGTCTTRVRRAPWVDRCARAAMAACNRAARAAYTPLPRRFLAWELLHRHPGELPCQDALVRTHRSRHPCPCDPHRGPHSWFPSSSRSRPAPGQRPGDTRARRWSRAASPSHGATPRCRPASPHPRSPGSPRTPRPRPVQPRGGSRSCPRARRRRSPRSVSGHGEPRHAAAQYQWCPCQKPFAASHDP